MSEVNWLSAIRIVDLTTAWAGPAVGRFLGALGADVVKVESARRPDIWRGSVNRTAGASVASRPYDLGPNFIGLNRNKRAISLEITIPAGREVFIRLIKAADVLVSNFSTRVLPNLGLDYETLQRINSSLILLNMPSLGASGPYKDLAGYGSIIEGLGGLASRFGYVDEGARVSQTFFPDGVAGIHASLALIAALEKRKRTGVGLYVDLSQQETMWLQLGEAIVMSSMFGTKPQRLGNAEPRRVPSGIFPTLDGSWIAMVVKTETQFLNLAALAAPHLDSFARFGLEGRLARRGPIESVFSAWTAMRESCELVRRLNSISIRAAQVNNYESGSKAPELLRLETFEQVGHPDVGPQTYLRTPLRFDGMPVTTRRPGVRFSEHTDEVLREWLGLDGLEISALRENGVVVDEIRFPN